MIDGSRNGMRRATLVAFGIVTAVLGSGVAIAAPSYQTPVNSSNSPNSAPSSGAAMAPSTGTPMAGTTTTTPAPTFTLPPAATTPEGTAKSNGNASSR